MIKDLIKLLFYELYKNHKFKNLKVVLQYSIFYFDEKRTYKSI